jgi:lipoprotein-anchoring transpeptidase ErfK/SrfK
MAWLLIVLAFEATGARMALAESPQSSKINQANLSPAKKVNPDRIFFPEQGQFVSDKILKFWRKNGKTDRLGNPVSRLASTAEGQIIQFFDKAAVAYFPELVNTQWETRPYHIGRIWLDLQPFEILRQAPFAPVGAVPNTKTVRYFPETGHTVQQGFLQLFDATGGVFMWGLPLGEEQQIYIGTQAYQAQLFERGRMLWSPQSGVTVDPNFGRDMAMAMGANLSPETNTGPDRAPTLAEAVWERWVDVNLSRFTISFMEDDVAVRTNYIISGKPGWETPTGTYYINRRVANERMRGGTIGSEEYYDLDNVLFTQYFTWNGHALHYAWWRSSFGYQASHGCVNMDYDTSLFAWNWVGVGSRVSIHF